MYRSAFAGAFLIAASPLLAQAPAPQPTPAAPETPAPAGQTTPAPASTIAVGTAITGPQGHPVGTVTAIEGSNAVVRTDKYDVRLPLTSIGKGPNGAVVGVTRDELNAGIEQAMARVSELLKPGTSVYDPTGGVVGSVDAADAQFVTLKLASGKLARLPRTGFSLGKSGLIFGLTAAQIEAQLPPQQ